MTVGMAAPEPAPRLFRLAFGARMRLIVDRGQMLKVEVGVHLR